MAAKSWAHLQRANSAESSICTATNSNPALPELASRSRANMHQIVRVMNKFVSFL